MTNGDCIYRKTVDYIYPGWLLRKTILEGFQLSENFVLQEIELWLTLPQG